MYEPLLWAHTLNSQTSEAAAVVMSSPPDFVKLETLIVGVEPANVTKPWQFTAAPVIAREVTAVYEYSQLSLTVTVTLPVPEVLEGTAAAPTSAKENVMFAEPSKALVLLPTVIFFVAASFVAVAALPEHAAAVVAVAALPVQAEEVAALPVQAAAVSAAFTTPSPSVS